MQFETERGKNVQPEQHTIGTAGSRDVPVHSFARLVVDNFNKQMADPTLGPAARHAAKLAAQQMLRGRGAEVEQLVVAAKNDLAETERKMESINRQAEAIKDVADWMEKCTREGLVLERPVGSALHKVRSATLAGDIIFFKEEDESVLDQSVQWPMFYSDQFNSFLIEHDWAAAFENATDFADGEIHLPFDYCCFELRFSGKRVCIFMGEPEDGPLTLYPVVETRAGWILPQWTYRYEAGSWLPATIKPVSDVYASFVRIAYQQIRAVCIALDAEVAVHEIVRAPHRLNAQRSKSGKLPLVDYHVVSLAHRTRAPVLEGGEPTGKHHRLHFVRGHWRHYPTHKTWIKWHLRGDPDLGFIDKHYRL